MSSTPTAAFVRVTQSIAYTILGLIIVVAIGALDWGWNIRFYQQFFPTFEAIPPAVALLFILGALATLYLGRPKNTLFEKIFVWTVGLILIVIGGLIYSHELDPGLQRMVVSNTNTMPTLLSLFFLDLEKLTLSIGVSFFMFGGALIFAPIEKFRLFRVAQVYILILPLFPLFSLVAWTYNLVGIYGITAELPMSIPIALLFLLLTIGFECVRPLQGWVALFSPRGRIVKWFQNLAIRMKIMMTFGLLMMLLLCFSFFSYLSISNINYELLMLHQNLSQAQMAMVDLSNETDKMLPKDGVVQMDEIEQRWNSHFRHVVQSVRKVQNYYAHTNDKEHATEFDQVLSALITYHEDVHRVFQSGMTPMGSTVEQLNFQGDSIHNFLQRKNNQLLLDTTEDMNLIQKYLATIAAIFLLAGGAFIYLIAFVISTPLQKLKEQADKIAEGDFSVKTHIDSKDEVGGLAQSLHRMTEHLVNSNVEKEMALHNLHEEKAKDEAILQSIADGLIAIDNEGKIIFVNDVTCELMNKKKEDLIGKNFCDETSIYTEEGEKMLCNEHPMHQCMYTRKTVTNNQLFYMRDGELFPAAISVAPILLNNLALGAIQVFRDITREREIDRAKNEFLSLASHQLRTPLTSIKWNIEMLLEETFGPFSEDQKMVLDQAYHSSERMGKLVDALLNVSNIQLGTFMVDPVRLDLRQLIIDVIEDNEGMIRQKSLQIVREFPSEMDEIPLDPKLTLVVLQNIVSNAVKYTPERGKITISVHIKNHNEKLHDYLFSKKAILVMVEDTGMGIPEDQQDKIFSKLFRADNVKKADTDGNGLGLYLTKTILESVGGKVWFTSEEGKGTTFYLVFPYEGMEKHQGNITLH